MNKKNMLTIIYFFLISAFYTELNYQTGNFTQRYATTMAIVNDFTIYIDKYKDILLQDKAYYNGHYLSVTPIGSSIMMIPQYLIFNTLLYKLVNKIASKNFTKIFIAWLVQIFSIGLYTAISMIYLFKILKEFFNFSDNDKKYIVFIFFGSLIFAYSTIGVGENFALLWFTLSLYYLLKNNFIKTGIFMGFAIITYYQSVMLILPYFIFFYLNKNKKGGIYFIIIIFSFIGLILLKNLILFGNPLIFQNNYNVWFENKGLSTWFGNDNGFHYFSIPTFTKLFNMLFGLWRGLLIYMPILFLYPISIYHLYKTNKNLAILFLFSSLLDFLFIYFMPNWEGGSCFGLRYITPFLIFYYIPIVWHLKNTKITLFTNILIILTLIINIAGAITDPHLNKNIENPLLNFVFPYLIFNGPENVIYYFIKHVILYKNYFINLLINLIPLFFTYLYFKWSLLKNENINNNSSI